MSPGQLESFGSVSTKAVKNISQRAWPNGAKLICACGCGYEKQKTAAEMNEYLKAWPKMHDLPAKVKPL